jgi:hypothetical protein
MSEISSPSRNRSNQRGKFRYSINAPMHYRVVPELRPSPWRKGHAKDMSASGMLLGLQEEVEPGTEIELTLDWIGLYHGTDRMRLRLWAQVLRRDERGTAVRIAGHRFEEIVSVVPSRYVRGKQKVKRAVA